MSLHFNTFIDNNSDHESNSEFIDNSLQQPYYENVSNTTGDYVTVQNSNIQESISTSNLQYHQASLQHDEHRIDSSQNQILKIELEIVIKLQNDQTQQRTQYVRSSTLPKNRIVNRMSPYRKPNEQNFRNKSRSNDAHSYSFMAVPQLNTRPAVNMQNVDNNRISRSQFQPDDDLNESFRSNYDN
ncbi:unnamed protein product [Rhizophagus irregularis]|nr:unnamed protein product [Rhizophagus irregularis]